MKKFLRSLMFFALTISVLLAGCSSTPMSGDDIEFVKLLRDPSVKDVNQSIALKHALEDPGFFASRDVLYFTIYNRSSNSIKFPSGSNVQIFLFHEDEKKWTEIQNTMEYYGDGRLIVPKGGGLDENLVEILPVYEKNGKEQLIRVAVTGYIVKDGQVSNEPVSAFVDMKIK